MAAPVIVPGKSKVKLQVTQGIRSGKSYALKEGVTYIGRQGPTSVDVDLSEQENPGVSIKNNRFALVWFNKDGLAIADTGRGITTVNGARIPTKQKVALKGDDTLQFGKTILQIKVIQKHGTGVQK
jgi:predicted component of type VI protein secretion system